ncbi:MAG: ABC-three component system protein [Pseudomonadota bacterium]
MGDQAARDINKALLVLPLSPTAIAELNDQYLAETAEQRNLDQCIDELNHFRFSLPYAQKDLSTKLVEGSRQLEIEEALFLKEKITKRILVLSKSPAAQLILSFALGKLKQSYLHKVFPQIQAGASHALVNQTLYDEVLVPVSQFLEMNPLNLSEEDLKAMVYFLAGNCHISWS